MGFSTFLEFNKSCQVTKTKENGRVVRDNAIFMYNFVYFWGSLTVGFPTGVIENICAGRVLYGKGGAVLGVVG